MLQTYTNLNGKPELPDSITALKKEQSAKTGREVVVVAYSSVRNAALSEDAEALARITELEHCPARKPARHCPGCFHNLIQKSG